MLSKLRNNIRQYQAYRATVKELSRLSNRDLADLGISRCDIPNIASSSTFG